MNNVLLPFPRSGLYAITLPEGRNSEQVVSDVIAAIKGGAVVIQYRDKQAVNAHQLAGALQETCRQFNVPLIINDDVTLAQRIGADGVHLGRDDAQLHRARELLGPQAIIGVSCYNSLQRAETAVQNSADYVAFGRFFTSTSKPLASPADPGTLTAAKTKLSVPIVAIGGILPENGGQLLRAGADVLAVIGGVFQHTPEQSAKAYQALFQSQQVS